MKFFAVFVIFILEFAHSQDDWIEKRSEFMEMGIDTNFRPCDDFERFATNGFTTDFFAKWRTDRAKRILSAQPAAQEPPVLQKVRRAYSNCLADRSILQIDRTFYPGATTEESLQRTQQLIDYIARNQFEDNTGFKEAYQKVLNTLWKFGSNFLSEKHFGRQIAVPKPENVTFGETDTCNSVFANDKTQCVNMMSYTFDVMFGSEKNARIYFPQDRISRRQLMDYFLFLFKSPKNPGFFANCEEMTLEIFPMYYKKLLFDEMEAHEGFAKMNTQLFQYLTTIVQQYSSTTRYLNITEEAKNKTYEYLKDYLKFEPIGHPIFENSNFEKYFGQLALSDNPDLNELSKLWKSRNVNNLKPIIQFNIDKDINFYWTPRLDEHTTIMKDGDFQYVGFNFEAFEPMFYHSTYTPAVMYPNFAFAFPTAALNQILFAAYAKWNANFTRRKHFSGKNIGEMSQDQLFYVALAQLIRLQGQKHFADIKDDIFIKIQCQYQFLNAFKCTEKYDSRPSTRCELLNENFFPNYNLSFYGNLRGVETLFPP